MKYSPDLYYSPHLLLQKPTLALLRIYTTFSPKYNQNLTCTYGMPNGGRKRLNELTVDPRKMQEMCQEKQRADAGGVGMVNDKTTIVSWPLPQLASLAGSQLAASPLTHETNKQRPFRRLELTFEP